MLYFHPKLFTSATDRTKGTVPFLSAKCLYGYQTARQQKGEDGSLQWKIYKQGLSQADILIWQADLFFSVKTELFCSSLEGGKSACRNIGSAQPFLTDFSLPDCKVKIFGHC